MATASPATYGLLGMLAVRSWTGYELTKQVRRSLRFVWPLSEGHLYREQKKLISLGWATAEEEPAGKRTRKRYSITDAGRDALRDWLGTEPEEPHFQLEGVLRAFYADRSTPQDLAASMRATCRMAREMLDEGVGFAKEYLEDGGPLWMLEQGVGGPDQERLEFHGRTMYPERLHVTALVLDVTSQLLEVLASFAAATADEVDGWPSTTHVSITARTRARLEAVASREP